MTQEKINLAYWIIFISVMAIFLIGYLLNI